MTAQPDKLAILRQWVHIAEDDYKTAIHMLTMGADCPYEIVCFHAQQCMEKYLKAVLTNSEIDFPKTHDIARIIQLLPRNIAIPIADMDQELMTSYATTARYPGDEDPITRSEAKKALAITRRIRNVIRAQLPKNALRKRTTTPPC